MVFFLIFQLAPMYPPDDRGVRDRERQGALIHFSSCQATEMTAHPRREEQPTRAPNPRAEHVKSMGSGRGSGWHKSSSVKIQSPHLSALYFLFVS